MPSKKAYDLVSDDGYDSRIPLHNEEAFRHGLQFQAKYIGTLDVPRPSSRVEIVAAMRRIRFEFKAKAIKKKKIVMTVSVDGVKVTIRKKKKTQLWLEESRLLIMQHPIYRIFYVSHDSQDLKIWSYIARDGPSNVFKCNVFKAYKKSQAMRIVRTIGQAFEVCHKLGGTSRPVSEIKGDEVSDAATGITESDGTRTASNATTTSSSPSKPSSPSKVDNNKNNKDKNKPNPPQDLSLRQSKVLSLSTPSSPRSPSAANTSMNSHSSHGNDSAIQLPLSKHHHMQLLRQQLEQQQHQTQVAIAQVHLLKDQLSAESAARIEAQARSHQLLLHNKDLLDHVSLLVSRVQSLELKVNGSNPQLHELDLASSIPQIPCMTTEVTTPRPAPVYLPDATTANQFFENEVMGGGKLFANTKATILETDSPDSGHKEMSSECLAMTANGIDWFNSSMTSSGNSVTLFDTGIQNGGWLTSSNNSSSPRGSLHSKSSTLKAGSGGSYNSDNNLLNISETNNNNSRSSIGSSNSHDLSIGSSTTANSNRDSFCSMNSSSSNSKFSNNSSSSSSTFNMSFNSANNSFHNDKPIGFRNDAYTTASPNLYRSPSHNTNLPFRKEASDKVKLISMSSSHDSFYQRPELRPSASMPVSLSNAISTSANGQITQQLPPPPPLPPIISQSQSQGFPVSPSNASLNSNTPSSSLSVSSAPKLDPPPRFRRSSRSIERWERGSWCGSGNVNGNGSGEAVNSNGGMGSGPMTSSVSEHSKLQYSDLDYYGNYGYNKRPHQPHFTHQHQPHPHPHHQQQHQQQQRQNMLHSHHSNGNTNNNISNVSPKTSYNNTLFNNNNGSNAALDMNCNNSPVNSSNNNSSYNIAGSPNIHGNHLTKRSSPGTFNSSTINNNNNIINSSNNGQNITSNSPGSGGVILRCHTRSSNSGSNNSITTAGLFRYSDSSARSSGYSDNRDSIGSVGTLRERLDKAVNDLDTNT